MSIQLKKLRAEAEQSQRKEAAAKAVLAAAKDAAREGRALGKDERSAVERPILYPQEAQEKPAPPPAVRCFLCRHCVLISGYWKAIVTLPRNADQG